MDNIELKNQKISDRKNQKILNNLVIIDGFSSSGKSLFASIFGYLDRCEDWQLDYRYEYITSLEALQKIDKASVIGLLNLWADNQIYDLFISRNINLRPSDASSPYAVGLQKKYLDRLEKKDGDCIISEIKNTNPILPLTVHYLGGYSKILFDAFGDKLKLYAITLRNPIELIKIWHEGNWVNRIGSDSRDYQLCIENNGKVFPWYVADYINEYKEANNFEKAVLTVYYFHKKMFSMVENIEERYKKKIMFIPFERFIVNPNSYIDEVCDRLNTKRNSNFDDIMKILEIPKKNTQHYFLTSKELIEQYVSDNSLKKYKNMIYELEIIYKKYL